MKNCIQEFICPDLEKRRYLAGQMEENEMSYVKIGVAGPVGSGKTALIEALSRKMAG